MALADTAVGVFNLNHTVSLNRLQDNGVVFGRDNYEHKINNAISNGTGSNQVTGVFSGQFTVTTGSSTISLADSVDPLGALGDDVPSEDPEGKALKSLIITNLDPTNYVTLGLGANALANVLGAGSTVRIFPGGTFAWYAAAGAGSAAMSDGADDEITLQANTASCICKMTYSFG